MTPPPAAARRPEAGSSGDAAPADETLRAAVRTGLGLAPAAPVTLVPVTRHSNINYVYRVEAAGRRLYVKVVPERPRGLDVPLPPGRVASEAAALRRFGELCGGLVAVPAVLFLDTGLCALGLEDVGGGREVLIDVVDRRYRLLGEQARPLGLALAAVHGGSRGAPPLRPDGERQIVRRVIYDGLIAPGARHLFAAAWEEIGAEMQSRSECLVHADLWAKNLLVAAGRPLALVDFEGAHLGDPAFDLGTLLAVATIPALAAPPLAPAAGAFAASLLAAYAAGAAGAAWSAGAVTRSLRYAGAFLAARGYGPFAYRLDETARQRLASLARTLAEDPPVTAAAFSRRLEAVCAPALGRAAGAGA